MILSISIGHGNGGLSAFRVDTSRLPFKSCSQDGNLGVSVSELVAEPLNSSHSNPVPSQATQKPSAAPSIEPAPEKKKGFKPAFGSALPTPDTESEAEYERRF